MCGRPSFSKNAKLKPWPFVPEQTSFEEGIFARNDESHLHENTHCKKKKLIPQNEFHTLTGKPNCINFHCSLLHLAEALSVPGNPRSEMVYITSALIYNVGLKGLCIDSIHLT